MNIFQDPFGEKRGKFDFQSILQRLEALKDKFQPEESISDLSDSDSQTDTVENGRAEDT